MTVLTTFAFPTQVQSFAAEDAIPDALVLSTSTPTVEVEGDANSVVVPFIEFTGAGYVPEGEDIDVDTPNTRTVTIYTGKIAELIAVSNEGYQQQNMPNLIQNAVRRVMTRKANQAYLAQVAPTAPDMTPPAGILNQGITDGGTVGASLDEIIDAIAGVEEAYGAATHVLANPLAWATLLKKKVATGSNQSLLGASTTDAARALLSVPVLTSASIPADTLIVLDAASILRAAGPLTIALSSDAFFTADSVAVRATWRFGARVADTSRVVKLTIS